MDLNQFLSNLNSQPNEINFADTMAVIDECYEFTPTAFTNGDVNNEANQNNGSCKIFAFGLLNNLSKQQTLACFGDYYRQDVLQNPDGDDHQNIRHFIKSGWIGIKFEAIALNAK
ncbi:MAG: HopJ type III effector protein [Methylophagaceae bacterium]